MPFRFQDTKLPGVKLVEYDAFADNRGYFAELFKHSAFEAGGIDDVFGQENLSFSTANVLRGLHFQRSPHGQAKLISVLDGVIFDVAADVDPKSATYLQWFGVTLKADEHRLLYIAEQYAHGFCVLSDSATVLYKTTSEYAPDHEGGVVWNDPDLAIDWPVSAPLVSDRDSALPRLRDAGRLAP
jgi:dTDP-4-dehydrorhamnose 3,5-epimerase